MCVFLRTLKSLFPTLLSQNLCLLYSLRSLEFWLFELISGLHRLGSNFRVHMPTSQVKTLSKGRFPGSFQSQPHSGSKKKAFLTNLSISPSLLLGCALNVQCPLQSINFKQDSTSPLYHVFLLLIIHGKGHTFHSYLPVHPQCLHINRENSVLWGFFLVFLLHMFTDFDHNLLSKWIWFVCVIFMF